MPFVLFIMAVVVAAITTYLYVAVNKNIGEMNYMAGRCSEHVRGILTRKQPAANNLFTAIFTVTDGEETYDIPYYRPVGENEFVSGREYDLYVDREVLKIAIREADKNNTENNSSRKLILVTGGFFTAIFVMIGLYIADPDRLKPLLVLGFGLIFYLISAFIEKTDIQKMEETSYVTEAVIVDVRVTRDKESESFYPVYRYRFGDQEYEAVSESSMKDRNEFHRNQEVEIRLNPDNPRNSVIVALEKRGLFIIKLFKILGIITTLLGLAMTIGFITL